MLSWTTARASDVNGVQPRPIPDRHASSTVASTTTSRPAPNRA